MKVIFHEDFCRVYTSDPAAAAGRMEAMVEEIQSYAAFITAEPATEDQIALAHDARQIEMGTVLKICVSLLLSD